MKNFDKHNILSETEFGFRSGLIIKQALFGLVSIIYQNNEFKTIAISLDLSKVFETVPYNLLIKNWKALE